MRTRLLLWVVPLIAACSVTPPPLVVTSNDPPGTVTIVPGQELVVRLRSNPSTGFQWTLADDPRSVLMPIGQARYVPDAAGAGRVGAGGSEAWTFRAKRTGAEDLVFRYRRPWESNDPPAQVFRLGVLVE